MVELFDDPQLQELVRIALVENKDLRIAVERIEEARARYGFTKADLWPKLDATRPPAVRFNSGSPIHTPEGDLPIGGPSDRTSIYSRTADVSWELDFFGRIRRATRGAAGPVPRHQEAGVPPC